MRWDIISAVLTCTSMLAVGHKKWQGWGLAFLNSVAVCILAVHVAPKQWALIPPNAFCLIIYTRNLINWRREAGCPKTARLTHCEGGWRVIFRVWRRLHHRYGLHPA